MSYLFHNDRKAKLLRLLAQLEMCPEIGCIDSRARYFNGGFAVYFEYDSVVFFYGRATVTQFGTRKTILRKKLNKSYRFWINKFPAL